MTLLFQVLYEWPRRCQVQRLRNHQASVILAKVYCFKFAKLYLQSWRKFTEEAIKTRKYFEQIERGIFSYNYRPLCFIYIMFYICYMYNMFYICYMYNMFYIYIYKLYIYVKFYGSWLWKSDIELNLWYFRKIIFFDYNGEVSP